MDVWFHMLDGVAKTPSVILLLVALNGRHQLGDRIRMMALGVSLVLALAGHWLAIYLYYG